MRFSIAFVVLLVAVSISRAASEIVFNASSQQLVGSSGSAGSSVVALGDMDGDGDLDAVGVQDNTGGFHRLWLNDGHGVFTLSTQINGPFSGNARNVTLADVDGDADLDVIFLTNNSGSAILVWLNQGVTTPGTPPTFVAQPGLSASTVCTDVAVGQLDGQVGVDLLVVGSGNTNAVWSGDGTGVFTRRPGTLTTESGQAVALGDLDGDTQLDAFALYSAGASPRLVLLNPGGTGALVPNGQTWPGVFSTGLRLALGDLDGDDDLDAFVATLSIPALEVWLNQGGAQAGTAGRFLKNGQTLSPTETGQDVALGDLDRDGDLDALVGRGGPNKVYVNDGFGQFTEAVGDVGSLVGGTRSLALGDLDGDGDLDAFLGKQGIADEIWFNDTVAAPPDPQGLLSDSGQTLGEDLTFAVALGDVDGDGDLDAVTTGREQNSEFAGDDPNRIWINQGRAQSGVEGVFVDSGVRLGTEAGYDVALGDLDGDGDRDIVVAGGDGATVYLNQGGAQNGVQGVFVPTGQHPGQGIEDVVLADFDRDGDLDLVVANAINTPLLFANLGGAQAGTPGLFATEGVRFDSPGGFLEFSDLVAFDADLDGDVDVIQSANPVPVLWKNPGTLVPWSGEKVLVTDRYVAAFAAANVDGDTDQDLVLAGAGTGVTFAINDGSGHFSLQPGNFGPDRPVVVVTGDLNGDGRPDVVTDDHGIPGTVSGDTIGTEVLLGAAGPALSVSQNLFSGTLRDIALGDLDGDGDLDAWFAAEGPDHVWLNGEPDLGPVLSHAVPPRLVGVDRYQKDWAAVDSVKITFRLGRAHTDPVVFVVDTAANDPHTITLVPGATSVSYFHANTAIGAATQTVTDHVEVIVQTPGVRFLGPQSFDLVMSAPEASNGCFVGALRGLAAWQKPLPVESKRPAGRSLLTTLATALDLDLDLYRRLRDEVLLTTPAGRYYTHQYETLSSDVLQAAVQSPVVFWEAYHGLTEWEPFVQALVDGQGATVEITEAMAVAARRFLDDLRAAADDGLRAKIDAEIAALDPDTWAGLSFDELLARVESQTRPPPGITTHPLAQAVSAGGVVTLSVTGDGAGPFTYQWFRSDVAIAGATAATYTLPSAQAFDAGDYTVTVANPFGDVTSNAAALAVNAPPASDARLLNLSTRALSLTGDQVLIPGFVVSGTGNKRLLIRAVGPTLGMSPYNLPGVLANPRLALKRLDFSTNPPGYLDVDANDDWITNPNAAAIMATGADLFAFALQSDFDAALLVDLAPGQYTVVADGVGGATGTAIVELYDADPAAPAPGSRLINISNRGFAGVGGEIMIPGFVISAEGPKTVLVRAVGPTLALDPYHVTGAMADPLLRVYRTETGGANTLLFTNNNWGDVPDPAATTQVAQQVSAFALASGSADAALVVTLAPGVYTVHGAAADGTSTGVLLVEVYVVP